MRLSQNVIGGGSLIGTDEVGVESRANDIVEKLRHDDNGAYVDAGVYRIYVQYVGNAPSSLFSIKGYTGGNGSISSSVGAYSSDFDDDEEEYSEQEREEERERERRKEEESREQKKEMQRKVDEINNAPMPDVKDIVMEIMTCVQKSDNFSFSYEERKAYESRAKLLTEYAKHKYANDPEVKTYLRKLTIHNNRFLIMWGVFLVAVVVVFFVCEEWWHYLFAVIGTIVVAVVLGLIHANYN